MPTTRSRSRAASRADDQGWPLSRRVPWLFPKLTGDALVHALPAVEEMYHDGPPVKTAASKSNGCHRRARATARWLHVTLHKLPYDGAARWWRLAVVAAMCAAWTWLTPLHSKLKATLAAVAYSYFELGFTRYVERGGRGYTSAAQLVANVLYTPLLLDGYATAIDALSPRLRSPGAHACCYVGLFPLNVWLFEVLLGHVLIAIYGHNVACAPPPAVTTPLPTRQHHSRASAWHVRAYACCLLYTSPSPRDS